MTARPPAGADNCWITCLISMKALSASDAILSFDPHLHLTFRRPNDELTITRMAIRTDVARDSRRSSLSCLPAVMLRRSRGM